jgi:hypothetical protein
MFKDTGPRPGRKQATTSNEESIMGKRDEQHVVVREDTAQYYAGGGALDARWTREPGAAERFQLDEAFKMAFEIDKHLTANSRVVPEKKIET